MKELIIYINDLSDLAYIEEPLTYKKVYGYELDKLLKKIHNSLIDYFASLETNRFYFGNEFCQFLMPSKNEITEICNYSVKKNMAFTFVTPLITDYGIEKLATLLDVIKTFNKYNEIIFNDWGVFELIKEKYKDFQCIPGRLIDKTLRDPRFTPYEYQNSFSNHGLKFFQRPSITSNSYKRYLEKHRLNRVELDVLPQGFNFSDNEIFPFLLSVYVPFGHLTTGRQCMMRMLSRSYDNKFILDDNCKKECKKYGQMMHKRQGGLLSDDENFKGDVDLLRKGNTVFYYSTNIEYINSLKCIDRIIFQPCFTI